MLGQHWQFFTHPKQGLSLSYRLPSVCLIPPKPPPLHQTQPYPPLSLLPRLSQPATSGESSLATYWSYATSTDGTYASWACSTDPDFSWSLHWQGHLLCCPLPGRLVECQREQGLEVGKKSLISSDTQASQPGCNSRKLGGCHVVNSGYISVCIMPILCLPATSQNALQNSWLSILAQLQLLQNSGRRMFMLRA